MKTKLGICKKHICYRQQYIFCYMLKAPLISAKGISGMCKNHNWYLWKAILNIFLLVVQFMVVHMVFLLSLTVFKSFVFWSCHVCECFLFWSCHVCEPNLCLACSTWEFYFIGFILDMLCLFCHKRESVIRNMLFLQLKISCVLLQWNMVAACWLK